VYKIQRIKMHGETVKITSTYNIYLQNCKSIYKPQIDILSNFQQDIPYNDPCPVRTTTTKLRLFRT